jgi:hypothetical protein
VNDGVTSLRENLEVITSSRAQGVPECVWDGSRDTCTVERSGGADVECLAGGATFVVGF